MIQVNNLVKKYNDLTVLNGVNEHIGKGEVIVVIGPSRSVCSLHLRRTALHEQPLAHPVAC